MSRRLLLGQRWARVRFLIRRQEPWVRRENGLAAAKILFLGRLRAIPDNPDFTFSRGNSGSLLHSPLSLRLRDRSSREQGDSCLVCSV